jgi:hypothetical protein
MILKYYQYFAHSVELFAIANWEMIGMLYSYGILAQKNVACHTSTVE